MAHYGKIATVEYVGTLDDGKVFDSTEGLDPLEFEVGSGAVIRGFDEAIASMNPGEERIVRIPAKEAYGEYDDEKIEYGPMYAIPNAKDIEIGKLFYFVTTEGLRFPAVVTEINEGIARIDFNHPLAGKDLTFKLKLLDVRDKE